LQKGPTNTVSSCHASIFPSISLCSTPTCTHTQKSSHAHLLAGIFNPPDFKTVHKVCRQLRAFASVTSPILFTAATCTFPDSFHEYIRLFCRSLTCHIVDPFASATWHVHSLFSCIIRSLLLVSHFGLATISRLLKIVRLFCRISSLL